MSRLVLLGVTLIFGLQVSAQDQCSGLDGLSTNAQQSIFLTSCLRDDECTRISCGIADPTTTQYVQEADLILLPCAVPTPRVQFQLANLNNGNRTIRFSEVIESSGVTPIMVEDENFGSIPLGTLTAFLNFTDTSSLGIMLSLMPPQSSAMIPLITFTTVELDQSSCTSTTPVQSTSTESSSPGSDTTVQSTTTEASSPGSDTTVQSTTTEAGSPGSDTTVQSTTTEAGSPGSNTTVQSTTTEAGSPGSNTTVTMTTGVASVSSTTEDTGVETTTNSAFTLNFSWVSLLTLILVCSMHMLVSV